MDGDDGDSEAGSSCAKASYDRLAVGDLRSLDSNSLDSYTMTVRASDGGSPWSTASESPTRRASDGDGDGDGEGEAPSQIHWPRQDERAQLLATEEESSDRQESDDDEDDDDESVWSVGPEQRRHYARQFELLRPDAEGRVPAKLARRFFEKSRLPAPDLHKIWLISDVAKDGSIRIDEFVAAMHLIVLRRKDVPVPDALPRRLLPPSPERTVTDTLVDLGPYDAPEAPSVAIDDERAAPAPADPDDTPPSIGSPAAPDAPARTKPDNREWTKFVDSPTSGASSPGPKPVNFDFHKSALERDPKIFHPVALRVTPDASSLPADGAGASPRRPDEGAHGVHDAQNADFKPIQRPQAKKGALKSVGALPPPPAREPSVASDDASGPASLQCAPKKDPPPPPPPRPLRAHARSSSLDLNRLKGSSSHGDPPRVPPRVSPSAVSPEGRRLANQRSEGGSDAPAPGFGSDDAFSRAPDDDTFANFARFRNDAPHAAPAVDLPRGGADFEDDDPARGGAPRKHGAFEVYRKPTPRGSESPDSSGRTDAVDGNLNRKDDSLKSLQEQNSILCRLCRELSLELADVQRERETLRIRLDASNAVV